MEGKTTIEEKKAIRKDLEERIRFSERLRIDFLKHFDENTCQKCGRKVLLILSVLILRW